MNRTRLVAAALVLLGLVIVGYASRAIAWQVQGFDPEIASGSADCDDCVVTATLDALPYVALGLLIYVLVAAAVWWWVFHRRSETR